jgi:serine/threonine protein kinase
MDFRRTEIELVLLAVQEGVISQAQVQECLRDREDREASSGQPDPRPLFRIAVEKGLLNPERIERLTTRREAPRTVVMIEVPMECASCGSARTLPLPEAVDLPRCPQCSSILRTRRGEKAPSRERPSGPQALVPEEVRKAMEDSRNRFGKYYLVSRLGLGGMGEVHKAWDTVLQRKVAIKIPRTMGEDEIRRLYVEAQGAGRLTHPNIASVYEIAEAEGRHYIAMQYIDGTTAEKRLEAMGSRRDVREIVRWVRDAALAVHYAHENSVVHRDLKPQNLMVDAGGHVYVMDFGLAKVLSSTGDATVSGMILGTPAFMPPEQAAGHVSEISPASDVYSLGATLYMLLCGKRPFESTSITEMLVRVLTSDPPPLRQVDPSLPAEIEAIVGKAMRKARELRYASSKDMAEDLTNFLQDRPVKARPPAITCRFYRKISRYRVHALTAALGVTVVLAAVLALSRREGPAPRPAPADSMEKWPAFFDELRQATSEETFRADAAAPLLDRVAREFPRQKSLVDEFVNSQMLIIRSSLESLPRDRWLESRERVERYRAWLAFMKKDTAWADRILAWRGTCTIQIHVHPFAEVGGPFVAAFPPQERYTPLTLREMAIADGDLELSHPAHGKLTIALRGLKNGASYVLEGTWDRKESIVLKEGQ